MAWALVYSPTIQLPCVPSKINKKQTTRTLDTLTSSLFREGRHNAGYQGNINHAALISSRHRLSRTGSQQKARRMSSHNKYPELETSQEISLRTPEATRRHIIPNITKNVNRTGICFEWTYPRITTNRKSAGSNANELKKERQAEDRAGNAPPKV